MLVLSRKVGEIIVLGDEVFFKVLGVKGNQVRLGIEAPMDFSIYRKEIYDRIQCEKRSVK